MAGVLVQNGFNLSLMAPDDLREYAGLTTTTITCKQHITLSSASMDLIKWALEGTFGAVEEIGPKTDTKEENVEGEKGSKEVSKLKEEAADEEIPIENEQAYLVMGCVVIRYFPRTREVELEWEGNMMNDGVADAVMAVLLTVESSPASVKRMLHILHHMGHCFQLLTPFFTESAKQKHHHHHHHDSLELPNPHSQLGPEERFARLLMMLEAQFGSEISPIERPRLPTAQLTNGAAKNEASAQMSAAEQTPKEEEEREDDDDDDDERLAELEAAELARLHALGIPVPGIEIRVDKHVARVWLEDLEVECANAVMRDRVRVVIERAVETVASMWAEGPPPATITNGETKEKLKEVLGSNGAEIDSIA